MASGSYVQWMADRLSQALRDAQLLFAEMFGDTLSDRVNDTITFAVTEAPC
jgi:hypothetical protein